MSILQAASLGGTGEILFLAGRLLFGFVLAFMGLNHFKDIEGMAGYAGSKGVPVPKVGVVASGVMLVLGGLGIAVGAFPVLAAGALAAFFVVTTPLMHDFWNADDPQSEMNDFLKNTALLGGSLVFLALGGIEWPLAANIGLF